jgi:UDP-N-acetylglucosamine diphosphorylase / glucose-1-phosphate thymidylyltransferase / UDP-N-acetylgalactosamine diphosphorylase / glucosamine-1-phosphate N-acetyltransferase / galactosamine-1-phosphate N-acetyltransferase
VIHTAAILARGLGSRMRQEDAHARLDATQAAAADAGVKGMIMIDRPFLDYVLSALADAGLTRVVLVIGPEHGIVRDYFAQQPPARVRLEFAVQPEPLGTADAVVAAASVIGNAPFLVLNADNFYPASALRALAALSTAGVVAFDRDGLLAGGGIEPERIRQFAVLDIAEDGTLRGIVEKPGASLDLASDAARWVSMNLWAITPELVTACREVARSARGEFELPEAIGHALQGGARVRVERSTAAVLDLSHRRDVAPVADKLRGTSVSP